MGFMDKVKGLVGGRKDQANQGIDKAASFVDEKTGGSHHDQIASATDRGKEEMGKLDDGGPSTPTP